MSLSLYVFLLLSVFWSMGDMDLDESVICSISVCVRRLCGVRVSHYVQGLVDC